MTVTVLIHTFIVSIIAADQERDRRQTCLPTGSSAAAAGCEARSAEHPADGNTRRLLPGAERPATTGSSAAAFSCRLQEQGYAKYKILHFYNHLSGMPDFFMTGK